MTTAAPAAPAAPAAYVQIKKMAGISNEDLCSRLSSAIRGSYPSDPNSCGPWVEALFDDRVVFSSAGKLWQSAYTFDAGTLQVALIGAPVEVVRDYVPVGTTAVAAAAAPPAEPPATAPAADAPAPAEKTEEMAPAVKAAAPLEWPADLSAELAARRAAARKPA